MPAQNASEQMGKLIYCAFQRGANQSDVQKWLADDLNAPHPLTGDAPEVQQRHTQFFEKYHNEAVFVGFHGFSDMILQRSL